MAIAVQRPRTSSITTDAYKNPPLETLNQIRQDTSIALAITISTSNRNNKRLATVLAGFWRVYSRERLSAGTIATASVETFSFSCGPMSFIAEKIAIVVYEAMNRSAVVVTGARQAGKSTLAEHLVPARP